MDDNHEMTESVPALSAADVTELKNVIKQLTERSNELYNRQTVQDDFIRGMLKSNNSADPHPRELPRHLPIERNTQELLKSTLIASFNGR